jgi:hypothetical protein
MADSSVHCQRGNRQSTHGKAWRGTCVLCFTPTRCHFLPLFLPFRPLFLWSCPVCDTVAKSMSLRPRVSVTFSWISCFFFDPSSSAVKRMFSPVVSITPSSSRSHSKLRSYRSSSESMLFRADSQIEPHLCAVVDHCILRGLLGGER